jgi:ornithine cyclodeaminase/alanine dehydrogenase-like protein (mu-crystallin family)
MAVLIYNDLETGYPLAIMDGTLITAHRTGATAAIASKHLARQDSHTLGLVGTGCQAYTQILAHGELFELNSINAFDISPAAADKLIGSLPRYPIRKCSLEDAVSSDIVCTLTPSRAPIIKREWIVTGTHINAIGADAAGKEELEPSILRDALVVVDDVRQASLGGEINVALTNGLFTVDKIYATLAEVIVGNRRQGNHCFRFYWCGD